MEKEEQEQIFREEANQIINLLGKFNNTYQDKSQYLIEAFIREHRTLQQSSFRTILRLIEFMATDAYRTDLRNESSKKVAKKFIDGFQTEYQKELIDSGMTERRAAECVGENFKPSDFLNFV